MKIQKNIWGGGGGGGVGSGGGGGGGGVSVDVIFIAKLLTDDVFALFCILSESRGKTDRGFCQTKFYFNSHGR